MNHTRKTKKKRAEGGQRTNDKTGHTEEARGHVAEAAHPVLKQPQRLDDFKHVFIVRYLLTTLLRIHTPHAVLSY
jgi:hypothetical protein